MWLVVCSCITWPWLGCMGAAYKDIMAALSTLGEAMFTRR